MGPHSVEARSAHIVLWKRLRQQVSIHTLRRTMVIHMLPKNRSIPRIDHLILRLGMEGPEIVH